MALLHCPNSGGLVVQAPPGLRQQVKCPRRGDQLRRCSKAHQLPHSGVQDIRVIEPDEGAPVAGNFQQHVATCSPTCGHMSHQMTHDNVSPQVTRGHVSFG